MTHQDFINKYIGKRIDRGDGSYQCVDLVLQYIEEVWGEKPNRCVKAKDAYYVNKERMGYSTVYDYYAELVTNDTNNLDQYPKQGDIVVFDGGKYGHIAIVDNANGREIRTIDQNWGKGSGTGKGVDAISFNNHPYLGSFPVLGWLVHKPKKLQQDDDMEAEMLKDCENAKENLMKQIEEKNKIIESYQRAAETLKKALESDVEKKTWNWLEFYKGFAKHGIDALVLGEVVIIALAWFANQNPDIAEYADQIMAFGNILLGTGIFGKNATQYKKIKEEYDNIRQGKDS